MQTAAKSVDFPSLPFPFLCVRSFPFFPFFSQAKKVKSMLAVASVARHEIKCSAFARKEKSKFEVQDGSNFAEEREREKKNEEAQM